jgi:malate synthase
LGKKHIKCNIWRVAVHPSYIQDARFLKVKSHITSVLRPEGKRLFRRDMRRQEDNIQQKFKENFVDIDQVTVQLCVPKDVAINIWIRKMDENFLIR